MRCCPTRALGQGKQSRYIHTHSDLIRDICLTHSQDAYVLASLLSDPATTPATLSIALEAYQHIRLPQAHHVQTGSRESGAMYEFDSVFGDDYETLGPAIERQWDWLWEGSADEDVKRGLEWMKAGRDEESQLT